MIQGTCARLRKPRARLAPFGPRFWGGVRELALTRLSPRRRPGLQPQVLEDPLDHHRFENGRDDLELPSAVRAVFEVGLKNPTEQSGLGWGAAQPASTAPAPGRYRL